MTPALAPEPASALTRQQKLLTLAGMLLAMFLAALDQTVVATAGPDIQKSLGIAPSLYTWITTAYLVSSTVLVPVYGKLSDTFGRKRIIVVGVVIFLVGSVACGLSQNTAQLILFRALQGVGSASIFTSAFAVVADLFSPRERGRYSGLFGAVFGVSSLVGPLLGGFLTDTVGWHWVFFINLPVGAVALTFIMLRMPALPGRRGVVDVPGAVLLAVGAVPLLLALSLGRPTVREGEVGFAWLSAPELGLFALALVGLAGFVAWELKVKEPLIDLRLFRLPMMAWGSAAVFVLGGAFLVPSVFLPLFMVNVVGVSATASGLTISPLVLGVVAGNVLSGQLVARLGRYKVIMLGSLALLSAAFGVMALTLTAASTQAEVTAKLVLLGLGLGPTIPLYTIAIQNAVPVPQLGVATPTVTFFRQMGSTVGLALVGSLFGVTLSHELDARLATATKDLPPAMVERFTRGPSTAGAGEAGGLAQGHFDAAQVKAQLAGQLDGAKAVAKKALAGDALAGVMVAQSPLADERLKATAKAGGVKAQVRSSFEALRTRIGLAAESPEAWAALQAAPDLPPGVKQQVAQVPAAVMADPVARRNALAGLRLGVDLAQAVAEQVALSQAVAQVEQTVDAAKPRLFAAVDAVDAALKDAFTLAIRRVFDVALALALLAWLLTVKLPQLPLRTTLGASAAPPVAD